MQAEADPSGCSLKLCERCLVCYDVRSEDTLLPFTPMASSGCSRAADPESEATESRSKLDEARIFFRRCHTWRAAPQGEGVLICAGASNE